MLLSLALALLPGLAAAVPLEFDSLVGTRAVPDNARTGESAFCTGTCVISGERAVFRRVVPGFEFNVFAEVLVSVKDQTDFGSVITNSGGTNSFGDPGIIPNYSGDGAGGGATPNDDLGFLYYGNNVNGVENGITLQINFLRRQSGEFVPITLPEIEFAVYDLDGESSQSEFFSASVNDGLASYRLTTESNGVTASFDDLSGDVLFTGGGVNLPETDPVGAAVLRYANVSSLTLDFGSVQTAGALQNAVFFGIDGDLSLFDGVDLTDPVLPGVPLPGSLVLAMSALAGLMLLRYRQSSG